MTFVNCSVAYLTSYIMGDEVNSDEPFEWDHLLFVRIWPESVCRISDKTGVSYCLTVLYCNVMLLSSKKNLRPFNYF